MSISIFRVKYTAQKMFPTDLPTFTEEILNGKLHFLCSEKTLTKENVFFQYICKNQLSPRILFMETPKKKVISIYNETSGPQVLFILTTKDALLTYFHLREPMNYLLRRLMLLHKFGIT